MNACQVCAAGKHANEDQTSCGDKTCTCAKGAAATGEECPEHGSAYCVSCNSGYRVNEAGGCVLNVCSCDGGVAVEGEECAVHGENMCASCSGGSFKNTMADGSSTCNQNECSCDNGKGAEGIACPENEQAKCESCHAGYFFTPATASCSRNQCTCDGGVAANGLVCLEHGAANCTSCSDGYMEHKEVWELDSSVHIQCLEGKECHCANGQPPAAHSAECRAVAGYEACTTCNDGFHKAANHTCAANVCHCTNGQPATGAACTDDSAHVCGTCDEDFERSDTQCVGFDEWCICKVPRSKPRKDVTKWCLGHETMFPACEKHNTVVRLA